MYMVGHHSTSPARLISLFCSIECLLLHKSLTSSEECSKNDAIELKRLIRNELAPHLNKF